MTTHSSPTMERRRFFRVQFDGTTEVVLAQQAQPVELIDLSLKGALIHSDHPLPDTTDSSFQLRINLLQGDTQLVFPASIVRTQDDTYGLRFDKIDLDTLTHLRRLLELNLGDEHLLERELEQLFPPA